MLFRSPDKGRHVQSTMWAYGRASDLAWAIRGGGPPEEVVAELRQRSVKGAWHREQRGQKHGGRSEPCLPPPASHTCSKLHSSRGPQLLGHSLRNAFPEALELARAC